MKTIRTNPSIFFILSLLLLVNCEKEKDRIYEKGQLIGQWRAYELVVDGDSYSEFALFNTYYTGIDFLNLEEARYLLIHEDGETCGKSNSFAWRLEENKLILIGEDLAAVKTLEVEKLTETELWLRYSEDKKSTLVKFQTVIGFENEEENPECQIKGMWSLIRYECCDLPAEIYEEYQITWGFDMESRKIHMINTVEFGKHSQYLFTESGSYDFDLGNEQLIIEYQDWSYSFKYDISENVLIVKDRPESDGPMLRFKKL